MMGRVLPDPLVHSEVSYNCTRTLCLNTLKPTHIHVHHHTHTYLLNPHLPGHHMASQPLMVSHYFSFSLWTGVCSPAGVSVIACRGEEKLDLSSLILSMSLLALFLSISHAAQRSIEGNGQTKAESIQLMPLNYDKLASLERIQDKRMKK